MPENGFDFTVVSKTINKSGRWRAPITHFANRQMCTNDLARFGVCSS